MPEYRIVGRGSQIGRKRKRTYVASSESQARELALADETVPEFVELVRVSSRYDSLAGCERKNADNTSRQIPIRQSKQWDELLLERGII